MTHENFNNLVDSLEEIRINTLKTKNAKYAPENDALHNFHAGAEIMGVTVPECIWGYATKHIVALRDKILRNDWEDKDDALEKIQDIQNYLTFIWCAINEDKTVEINKENTDFDYDFEENIYDCNNCKFDYIGENDSDLDETGMHIIIEPCKSCRNNINKNEPEYRTAPINFVKKES
jgi:hypothetical protein